MSDEASVDVPRELLESFLPVALLGEGTYGTVLEARDLKLGRMVAIKLLRRQDDESRIRFMREAALLAQLEHPNIVRLFDYGMASEVPYLVMERLEGRNLLDLGTTRDPLEVMLEVASALDAVHAAGVVHRDLKLANVLLTDDGRVVLMDFGLAHDSGKTGLTRTGRVLGSLNYMAPEVLLGAPPNPASDWYSWGVMLYRLLEEKVPFTGDAVMAGLRKGQLPPLGFSRLGPEDPLRHLLVRQLSEVREQRLQSRRAVEAFLARSSTELSLPAAEPFADRSMMLSPLTEEAPAPASAPPEPLSTPATLGRRLRTLAMVLAVGLLLAGGWLVTEPPAPEPSPPPATPPRTVTWVVPPGLTPLGRNEHGFETYLDERDRSTLVLVPAGEFPSRLGTGGAPAEARRVHLEAFLIGRTEVTTGRYARFLEETGHPPPLFWSLQETQRVNPVTYVDWDDARTYCAWAGGRLPTALEWEKAAVGPEGRRYPWGDAPAAVGMANLNFQGDLSDALYYPIDKLTMVEAFPHTASPYGLLQMAGNVAEWAADLDVPGSRAPRDDEVRVCMGTSWASLLENLESWDHRRWKVTNRDGVTGFRMAMSLVAVEDAP